jgi:virulence-associated protein VagC
MATARVFKSGNSQAIKLPRAPKAKNITRAFELLRSLPDDFLPVRGEEPSQTRDGQYTPIC